MSHPKIVAVVPTIRPESMAEFRRAWAPLFQKHRVTLVTVWDGESPHVTELRPTDEIPHPAHVPFDPKDADLFVRRSDACRNLGFVAAAAMGADFVLTLDDDVAPAPADPSLSTVDRLAYNRFDLFDPIQAHLDALSRRAPLSWMNTAHMGAEYLRGVPYGVRDEAPVMLSHGVWVGTPDFDGETQLRLENSSGKVPCDNCDRSKSIFPGYVEETRDDGAYRHVLCPKCGGTKEIPAGVPKTLPYYVGPVPRGVLFPLCGMNVMVRREALPYLYFAPMGADSGFPDLHRFADIWMGVYLKREFDRLGWACYTGASTVLHTRASDAAKNFEQERLGREWNERFGVGVGPDMVFGMLNNPPGFFDYMTAYADKRTRFAALIRSIQEQS